MNNEEKDGIEADATWDEIKSHVDTQAKTIAKELRNHPDRGTHEMQQSGFYPYNLSGKLSAYQEMQVFLNQFQLDTIECPTCKGKMVHKSDEHPFIFACLYCKGTGRVPKPQGCECGSESPSKECKCTEPIGHTGPHYGYNACGGKIGWADSPEPPTTDDEGVDK